MATKLFISYRRDNGKFYANLLYQLLKQRKQSLIINEYTVFLDTKGLEPGPFPEQLLRQIERCDYFLLLLTEGALDRPFVQREIKHALKHKKKIIPIIDKYSSYRKFLPESLKKLQNIETDIQDTNQIDFVVQQLENYMSKTKSRSWSKYFLIGLIPIIVGVVAFLPKDFFRASGVGYVITDEPEQDERGVTRDKGSEFGDPIPPSYNGGSQTNPPRGQTTKKPKPEPEPQPPQSKQDSLNGSNTTFKASGRIINGSNDKIIGNSNKINGSNNEITGDSNEIHGSNNKIHGNYNRIYGSNNTCYGHGNEFISGSNNKEI